jgi:hypothetical protein
VQKTIDRIIFLRICEDRAIEEYGRLTRIAEGKDIYERLKQVFLLRMISTTQGSSTSPRSRGGRSLTT